MHTDLNVRIQKIMKRFGLIGLRATKLAQFLLDLMKKKPHQVCGFS